MADTLSGVPVPATETTFFGATIPGTITGTLHSWTADQNGLFHTATDLNAEWQGYYDTMLAGHADTLSFVQRLEGNAQAVFLNTRLNSQSAANQARDREDVQREFDAIAATAKKLGLSTTAPLTTVDYLKVGQAMQADPVLEELAMQGHGLNSPSVAKYNGYTNDFQNNVDGSTLYIGGGLDNNQNALATFMDDVVLSHLPFPTVAQDGQLEQLNQNGDAEDSLSDSTGAFDQAGCVRVYTPADFSTNAGTAGNTPAAPPPAPSGALPSTQMYSLTGMVVPTTLTVNGDTWVADSNGLYQTTTDLAALWQGYYQQMLAGNGASLTGIQRLEGNAEAVFENTGLARLARTNAIQLRLDREDVQRELDAIAATMTTLGISNTAPLTLANYLALEHGLQGNAALEELAIQGHGLNDPSNPRENGYTTDFQNTVDQKTLYVGPGIDSGEQAIAALFDDGILTHVMFPTIAQDGRLEQLNQNGDAEDTAQFSVEGMNQFMFGRTLTAADFNIPGNPAGANAAGTVTTLFGNTIASTMTAGAHVWTIGTDGRFHTATNLQTEWQGYYQQMLAGNGASLTAIQRLEGNAEAVFENTGLSNLKKYGTAAQQSYREDAQREFDAIAVAMKQLGLGGALLTNQDYLHIASVIQSSPALEELAIQGHGLNDSPQSKYCGYTGDFQNNSDNATYYVGGGGDNGERAITNFFDDIILSHLPFPVVPENGTLEQLNQNANNEDTLTTVVSETNDAMFRRVYVAGDFSKTASAAGPQVFVTAASATATPPAAPAAGAGQILSLYGDVIPATLTVNGDTWVADSAGRYETTTDLTLSWYNAYQTALAGGSLTLTQRWEAQAEAVFLNTALSQAGEGQQAIDRQDVQREIDAVVATMTSLGLGSAPLTAQNYLSIEHALQNNAALEELALQGHGLNNPWVAGQTEYNGFTNDFQYIDGHRLYTGPGANSGERAIADFFDDSIMTHLPFAAVVQNGEIEQLNQNGNAESTVGAAVGELNQTLFGAILTASNFVTPGAQAAPAAAAGPSTITTFYGQTIAATITVNGHTWVADANGEFQTTANLQMEWRTDYQIMLAGKGGTLTATQRLEGNAEAVFENTNINGMWQGAAKEAAYREDVQREIDAIAGAMQIDFSSYGISLSAPLTEASYLQLGTTLHGNASLEELALQGTGVTRPPSVQYRGALADFINGADWNTYFVGGGPDNGKLVLPYVFSDIVSDLPFAAAYENGAWQQLNQNGDVAETVIQAATALNTSMDSQVFVAADFSQSATATGPVVLIPNAVNTAAAPISAIVPAAGKVVTLSGVQIANSMTVNGHTWTADRNGTFQTTANLATEWQGYYAAMLNGGGGSLTAIQRLEGNAEAVFEATGLTKLSAAQQQIDRSDVQRQIDAMAGAIAIDAASLNIPSQAVLLAGSYQALEQTLQGNAALEELAVQGHGLSGANSIRYSGYANDIANANSKVKYTGGGLNNGKNALSAFLGGNILGNTPFAIVWHNGKLMQLDLNGQPVMALADAVAAADDAMWYRTYKASDFSK
jgi:predicted lipoprotein with Yx(FWY)xxD motif